MKLGKILWSLLFSLLLLSACDDKKDGFSGLSDLVEKRSEVRKTISEKNTRKKILEQPPSSVNSKDPVLLAKENKKAKVSPIVLYERDIEVVDSYNRVALAKGVAYLNKEGQIVKIRIIKE